MNNPKIIAALEDIAAKNAGILRAQDVVKAARSPKSVLHSQFEWDNDKAADEWRMQQARGLIRATVHWIEIGGQKEQVNVFVSLGPDRTEGGGYRGLISVLANPSLREQMLLDAIVELKRLQVKYARLSELAAVFEAAERVAAGVGAEKAA